MPTKIGGGAVCAVRVTSSGEAPGQSEELREGAAHTVRATAAAVSPGAVRRGSRGERKGPGDKLGWDTQIVDKASTYYSKVATKGTNKAPTRLQKSSNK